MKEVFWSEGEKRFRADIYIYFYDFFFLENIELLLIIYTIKENDEKSFEY